MVGASSTGSYHSLSLRVQEQTTRSHVAFQSHMWRNRKIHYWVGLTPYGVGSFHTKHIYMTASNLLCCNHPMHLCVRHTTPFLNYKLLLCDHHMHFNLYIMENLLYYFYIYMHEKVAPAMINPTALTLFIDHVVSNATLKAVWFLSWRTKHMTMLTISWILAI